MSLLHKLKILFLGKRIKKKEAFYKEIEEAHKIVSLQCIDENGKRIHRYIHQDEIDKQIITKKAI